MVSLKEQLEKLLEPVVEGLGYELVETTYTKEGQEWFLRLFIDQPGGVTLDDCEQVSRKVEIILDREDPIPHAYRLEVSSPGLERPLRKPEDFQRFKGQQIAISTFISLDGQRHFKGCLLGLEEDEVWLELAEDKKRRAVPLSKIARAHLIASW